MSPGQSHPGFRPRRVASRAEPLERAADEAAAHHVELCCEFEGQLGTARAAGAVAPADGGEAGALEEPALTLGRGAEAAEVPRLDADAAQLGEGLQHSECVVAERVAR